MPAKNPDTHRNIAGQRNPKDTMAKLFWSDNERFAAVFNNTFSFITPISPDDLVEMDSNEFCTIEVKNGSSVKLQQPQDILKAVKSNGVMLAILGLEDMSQVDYLLPYRIWSYTFINVSRQIQTIRRRHLREQEAERQKQKENKDVSEGSIKRNHLEILNGFYREDRIIPVVQLIVYTGKEKWDAKVKLEDLFIQNDYTKYMGSFEIYVLDVRHMTPEALKKYPKELQELFGFLMYENTNKLYDFVHDKSLGFDNLPVEIFDFILEITDSSMLKKIRKMKRTPEGGINVCYGIEVYAQKRVDDAKKEYEKHLQNKDKMLQDKDKMLQDKDRMLQNKDRMLQDKDKAIADMERRTFVTTAQSFGIDLADVVRKYAEQFRVSLQKARYDVKRYWVPAC
ncbi:MAG: Rpn family recombination-promoting nuclease/putative transposase [Clostridia bacterium]|nr:Rpn family recombination-promoting nuclease/putative transposase [Clostridia bacterium]